MPEILQEPVATRAQLRPPPIERPIGWFRWLGLAALIAAMSSFVAAAASQIFAPGSAAARLLFWLAIGLNLFCLVMLPLLLILAIRARRLPRKEWRLVMMRAIWGGPFGTLGALWDLCNPPAEILPPVEGTR
ncbi:MAG: hypothetical protein ABI639_01970 [Thermoanaerobaculia bacterium]